MSGKGAPQWWKDDPDKAWEDFVSADQECSRLGRILSNVEFQRDWLQKALNQIGILLPAPHPEHPEDIAHKEAMLIKAIEELRFDDTEEVKKLSQLSPDEMADLVEVLDDSGVDQAITRLNALWIRSAMIDLRRRLMELHCGREA